MVTAAQIVDSNFHLYLLIGQSNMAGRGQIDSKSKIINPQILMLDSNNNWIPATDPVHFDKPKMAGVGPAISFAEAMLKSSPKGTKIGLIPCAWGGSPIKVWQPGAKYFNAHPYDNALLRTKLAMQTGVLKGVLWHQGESDNDSLKAAKYLPQLITFIANLRKDFNQPLLPFIAGEIGYFNKNIVIINDYIHQLPQKVKNTAVVSAEGLEHKGDRLHFDTPSARKLGKRYAIAMLKLQKR
ncbi:MAG: sialate O-acetylesterase [Niabella sp.]